MEEKQIVLATTVGGTGILGMVGQSLFTISILLVVGGLFLWWLDREPKPKKEKKDEQASQSDQGQQQQNGTPSQNAGTQGTAEPSQPASTEQQQPVSTS